MSSLTNPDMELIVQKKSQKPFHQKTGGNRKPLYFGTENNALKNVYPVISNYTSFLMARVYFYTTIGFVLGLKEDKPNRVVYFHFDIPSPQFLSGFPPVRLENYA